MASTEAHRRPRMVRMAFWILITAAVGYGSDWFAMRFTLPDSLVSVIYPNMGLTVGIGILVGPWVAIGAFLGEMALQTNATGPVPALGFSLAGATQVFAISWAVRRWLGGRRVLDTRNGVFLFAAVAGLFGTVISATGGVATLVLAGFIGHDEVLWSWLTWWAADAVSIVLITPLILVWTQRSPLRSSNTRERALVGVAAAVIAAATIALAADHTSFLLAMAGLPLVAWAGFRLDQRTVVTVSLALGIAAFAYLAVPWRSAPANITLLLESQVFIALACVFGLAVHAWSREERQRLRQAAAREFAAVTETRNRLLQSFAHELNNPLTPMKLELSALQRGLAGPLTEEQQQRITVVIRNTDRLSSLVRDLRDVAQTETGTGAALERREVDMTALLERVVDRNRTMAHERGIDLTPDLRASHRVHGDGDRLARAFAILLDNAMKHTQTGQAVDVAVVDTADGCRISIATRGRGLTKRRIERLFGLARAAQAEPHDELETVVGLHTARGIITSHAGTLKCRTNMSVNGLRFLVELPASAPPANVARPLPTRAEVAA